MSSPNPIVDALRLRDDSGRVVLDTGLRATLYFRNGHTLQHRQAVASSFTEFYQMASGHLRWALPRAPGFKGDGPLERRATALIASLTANTFDEDESWEFQWHGGQTADSANDLQIEGYGCRRWESNPPHNDLSFLSVVFPLTFFLQKPAGFPSLVLRWSERLQPIHGYGGIGISYSPDPFVAEQYGTSILALATRFPGLEIDYPAHHTLWLKSGIKGGNWLTVLSTEMVSKLGTIDRLSAALDERFVLTEYDGGLMIQAGPAPELGDSNRQLRTPNYTNLAKILKPIRTMTHGAIHGMGGFDRERFEAWLARFDE
jgi:hypothetical protein